MTEFDNYLVHQHQITEQDLSQQLSVLGMHQCLTLGKIDFRHGATVLQLWKLWRKVRPANSSRIHLVVTAKNPLAEQDIRLALAKYPDYAALTEQLLAQYPPAIPGIHRLIFPNDRLTLDLWFGDPIDDLQTGQAPVISPQLTGSEPPSFAVIGAGIAGLSITEALTRRGYAVTLIEQDQPLAGASGNPKALLLSKLPKRGRVSHNLQTLGALSTARWWGHWTPNVITSVGALLQADEDDLEKIKDYPTDLVQLIPQHELHARTGLTSVHPQMLMPRAVAIDPQAIRDHVLSSPLVTVVQQRVAQLKPSTDSLWTLLDSHNLPIIERTHIIVASAKDSERLCPSLPLLTVIRGQMSWVDQCDHPSRLALGYGGYAVNDGHRLILGSSFIRDDLDCALRASEHQSNFNLLNQAFPAIAAKLPGIESWQGRVSQRVLPRDSMPIVGEIALMKGVYALTGLGAKGFSFAPLCAELLAALILGEAMPIPNQLITALCADRFIKKERIRKPYYTAPKDN